MESLQWIVLLAMGGLLGYFWRRRREERVPAWLLRLHEEELVTRDMLDRYHHRVLQISQLQKDLIHSKSEELQKNIDALSRQLQTVATSPAYHPVTNTQPEPNPSPPAQERLEHVAVEPPQFQETFVPDLTPPEVFAPSKPSAHSKVVAPPIPPSNYGQTSMAKGLQALLESGEEAAAPVPVDAPGCTPDLPGQAWQLWLDGCDQDQIAQKLRIGRQEVQLLIRMFKQRPATAGLTAAARGRNA